MSLPLVNYPFSQFDGVLSQTQPFTYRDGRTFAQVLEGLKNFVLQFEEVLNEQGMAINSTVTRINETIADLLSKILQFTITRNPVGDEFAAKFGDGTNFEAYTKSGVDKAIEALNTALTAALTESQDQQTQTLTENLNNVDTALKGLISQLRSDHDSVVETQGQTNASVASNLATINSAIEALQNSDTQFRGDITQYKTEVNNRIEAEVKAARLFTNVRHYGAVGDGVADDTAAIRAAATAAGTGGRVWFPKGIYRITDTVDLLIQQEWQGENSAMDMQTLHCGIKYEGNGIAIRAANGVIQNLRIDGPGQDRSGTIGIYSEASGLKLRDVGIRDFATGLSIKEVWYCYLDNVFLMRNNLGFLVTYSYNVACYNLRVHCDLGNGLKGRGIELQSRSLLSMHGGSIEQYATGVLCTADTGFYASGVYWETGPSNQAHKYGIKTEGLYAAVTLIGCQVIISYHTAWCAVTSNESADRIVGIGNKFKASVPGDGNAAYSWLNGHRATLSMTLIGDNFREPGVRGGYVYRPNTSIPKSSIILDPVGSADHMLYGGGEGRLTLGSGISVADSEGEMSGVKIGNVAHTPANSSDKFYTGTLLYDTARKKVIVFNGTDWDDVN